MSIRPLRPLRLLAAVLFAVLAVTTARAHDAQAPSPLANLPQPATAVITGSVDELVIDDRVNGTLVHLHALRQDDGSVVALSGEGAETLQKGTRVEVTGTLRGATLEVTAYSVLAAASMVDKASGRRQSRSRCRARWWSGTRITSPRAGRVRLRRL